MKLIDYAVRELVTATFFGLLLFPSTLGAPLAFMSTTAVGIWAILFPQGILGWAKRAHPTLDPDDSSLWWVPRLIGVCFLIFELLFLIASRGSW
jgi:hypothetical protein